jgi:hypothetical protein
MPKKDAKTRQKPPLRTVSATERLTPSERKEIFARNLDQLIRLAGLKRNEAAKQIGTPYPLIRRLASAGVSRLDELNEGNIQKIACFFQVSDPLDLWQPELLLWLLKPEHPEYHRPFINRFRDDLARVQYEGTPSREKVEPSLLAMIGTAIGGVAQSTPPLSGHLGKVEAILASSKSKQFKYLIDDYYEIIAEERAATG